MQVSVDINRCDLTGFCCEILPEAFEIRDDTLYVTTSVSDQDAEKLTEAVAMCPTEAICVSPDSPD